MAEFTTVFLSSTTQDLQPWRDAVYAAIGKMAGLHCVRMEDFGALDADPLATCRAKVAECDLFVGLVGHFFGSRPEGSDLSCTQVEYEEAARLGRPRLMFLADDEFALPARLGREPEDLYRQQVAFRERVRLERTIKTFHEPDKLATLVVAALQSHLAQARRGAAKGFPLVKSSVPVPPDDGALLRSYLGHLIGKIEHLTLQGIDPAVKDAGHDPRLKLNGVYTALRTQSFEGEAGPHGKAEAAAREALEERRPLSALELLDREGRLVLLGDPGSGKSTFVNFVALCLAGERLGREDLNLKLLNAAEATAEATAEGDPERAAGSARPARRDRKVPKAPAWSRGSLLPVRIVLRDFAAKGRLPAPGMPVQAGALWDFLKVELETDCGLPTLFPYLQDELLAGRCLVLLDGLDEVPEAQDRRHQILQAVEAWASGLGSSRLLVTSRTYAYQKQEWKLNGFAEATLAPFSREQIGRFVDLWYEQMVALGRFTEDGARGRAELLRRAIFGSERLLALAERPLLLTLAASLHAWRGGVLPDRREELYRDAVELLLDTWERHRLRLDDQSETLLREPSLAEWLRVDRQEVRQVLEELAFAAHRAQPDLAGTADVAEGDLVARLLHLKRNSDAHPGQLVAYLTNRSGILVERGNGVFTFPHRTFQEYLAACHLTNASDLEEIAELAKADPGRWREVVLLAGAKAASGSKASVWYLAEALCGQEPGEAGAGPAEEWGALLAGQMVAESADLSRVGKANQGKLERLQRWMVHLMRRESFPVLERALAGKLLAALGDPRFDSEHWFLPREPAMGFLEVPAGKFRMGSDEGEPESFADERPRHEVVMPRFWLARYPVTVGQFAAFVASSGHAMPDLRWQEGPSNQPVAYVDWADALAYCNWLGKRLLAQATSPEGWPWPAGAPEWSEGLAAGRLRVTLPSEAEWEKAARGTEGLTYPWGASAEPNRANYYDTGLGERSSVGCFPGGLSPSRHEEMSGNVWEWTRSLWGEDLMRPQFGYPYKPADGREVLEASPKVLRVVRGGAFSSFSRIVRCAYRSGFGPASRYDFIGFRVVLSPFPL